MNTNYSVLNPNFRAKYTILGKENRHVPYLHNQVAEILEGKGITTVYELGEKNRIQMEIPTKSMFESIKSKFEKLGIVFSKNEK